MTGPMNDFVATSVAAIDEREREREKKTGRVRGEIIRQVREEEEEEEEVRGRKEDQPVTILSHVGHRRPQTGHRIPTLATGGRKWSGRSFYSENRPIFCKTFFSGRGLPPFTRRSDHLVLHSRGECPSNRDSRLMERRVSTIFDLCLFGTYLTPLNSIFI